MNEAVEIERDGALQAFPEEQALATAEEELRTVEARRSELTSQIEEWRQRIETVTGETESLHSRLLHLAPDGAEFRKAAKERAEKQITAGILQEQLAAKASDLAALPSTSALERQVKLAELRLLRARLAAEVPAITELLATQIGPVAKRISSFWRELSPGLKAAFEMGTPRLFDDLWPLSFGHPDPATFEFWKMCSKIFDQHLKCKKTVDTGTAECAPYEQGGPLRMPPPIQAKPLRPERPTPRSTSVVGHVGT